MELKGPAGLQPIGAHGPVAVSLSEVVGSAPKQGYAAKLGEERIICSSLAPGGWGGRWRTRT